MRPSSTSWSASYPFDASWANAFMPTPSSGRSSGSALPPTSRLSASPFGMPGATEKGMSCACRVAAGRPSIPGVRPMATSDPRSGWQGSASPTLDSRPDRLPGAWRRQGLGPESRNLPATAARRCAPRPWPCGVSPRAARRAAAHAAAPSPRPLQIPGPRALGHHWTVGGRATWNAASILCREPRPGDACPPAPVGPILGGPSAQGTSKGDGRSLRPRQDGALDQGFSGGPGAPSLMIEPRDPDVVGRVWIASAILGSRQVRASGKSGS